MNTNTAVCSMAKQEQLAPGDIVYLKAMQDPVKREMLIQYLVSRGLYEDPFRRRF